MAEPVTTNQRVILLAYGDELFVYSVAQRDQAYQVYAVVEATGLQVAIGEMPKSTGPAPAERSKRACRRCRSTTCESGPLMARFVTEVTADFDKDRFAEPHEAGCDAPNGIAGWPEYEGRGRPEARRPLE